MSSIVHLHCEDCTEDGPNLRLSWQAGRAMILPHIDNPAYRDADQMLREAAAHRDWVQFFEAHEYHEIQVRWRGG